MPELDYVTVRGFRSLANVEEVPLRAINVLIGANGSGKSNFVGAFALLQAVRNDRLSEFVGRAGGAERLLHFGSKRTDSIQIVVTFKNPLRSYEVKLGVSTDDDLFVKEEMASGAESDRPVRTVRSWIEKQLGSWRIYHFHDTSGTSPMKRTGALDDNRFLRSDAENLAAFLYFLRERENDCYQGIRKTIQRVAPFFDDFQLEPSRLNPDRIKLEWMHRGSDSYFDAGSLSDGTLRFMALATLFLQPKKLRPSVIIVDEPEIGLHPYAITMLAALVQQAAVETQVILSTQSSLLLDHFEPEDVLVAEQENGATTLKTLDAKELESWLEDYSLGQLWEKNELGGRPGGI